MLSAGYTIDTLANLKSLNTSELPDGYSRLLVAKKAWYVYISSGTGTGDDEFIIVPNSNTGRWFKLTASLISGQITNTDISNSANIAQSKISGLTAALDGKSNVGHTHTAADITNFNEAAQDAIASSLISGANISIDYNDTANTITITGTGSSSSGLANWDDLYSASASGWDSEYN